jgi:hypothetical protein
MPLVRDTAVRTSIPVFKPFRTNSVNHPVYSGQMTFLNTFNFFLFLFFDGFSSLACSHSELILKYECRRLLWMGDQPVTKQLPKQDNTNTETKGRFDTDICDDNMKQNE